MRTHPEQRGFVALISSIVISVALLTAVLGVGAISFFARFDALGMEEKRTAHSLAESCVNVALLALATSTDPSHFSAGGEIVNVGVDAHGEPTTCIIKDVTHDGSSVTVAAYASSNDSFAEITASASLPPDIHIVSWDETGK